MISAVPQPVSPAPPTVRGATWCALIGPPDGDFRAKNPDFRAARRCVPPSGSGPVGRRAAVSRGFSGDFLGGRSSPHQFGEAVTTSVITILVSPLTGTVIGRNPAEKAGYSSRSVRLTGRHATAPAVPPGGHGLPRDRHRAISPASFDASGGRITCPVERGFPKSAPTVVRSPRAAAASRSSVSRDSVSREGMPPGLSRLASTRSARVRGRSRRRDEVVRDVASPSMPRPRWSRSPGFPSFQRSCLTGVSFVP